MKRRILVSLLSLLLVFSLIPTVAYAADEADIAINATQIEGEEEEFTDDSPEESEEDPAEESEEEAPAEESEGESEEDSAEEPEGEAEEDPAEEPEKESQGDLAEESGGEAQVQVQAAADKGNITMQVAADAAVAQVGSMTCSTLADAIEAAGSEGTVTLLANVTEDVVIASGTTITLDLNGCTLTGTGSGSVITVDGALTLKDSGTGGTVTGGSATNGGVYASGEFTMTGGEISGNTATESGGGVSVSCSTFTMKGGTISGNEAVYGGGLAVQYSEATMSDGEISDNEAGEGGGGVYIFGYEYAESQFTMNGGKISGNEALYGGGVFLSGIDPAEGFDGCTFIMNDGEISDNESYAGGVYVQYSTFTMTGGAISENEATYEYYNYEGYEFYVYGYGGGVYVYSGAVAMEGGVISNNSAVYGGGVIATGDVDYPCTFDMSGGEISGNTASKNGGGVCVGFKDDIFGTIYGAFDMSGGEISGNEATGYGGGVYVTGVDVTPGTFTMTGGAVSGNTSSSAGGGVYVDSYGAVNVSGSPVVSGNTEDNVYLPSGTYITLAGALTDGASIGVTTEDEPTAAAAVEITAAETSTTYYSASLSYFSSDNTAYYVRANSTGKHLELGLRTKLTEDDLDVDTTAETYTGSAITKSIESNLVENTDYTVSYSANTDAGDVTITITGIGAYIGELTYTFTIDSKTVTLSISGDISKTYDGKAVSDPTVSVTLAGSDTDYTQTVTYYSVADDGTETALSEAPFDVGSYKVVVTVDAGDNYNVGTAEASFSIFAAEQDVTIEGFTDVVYDGQAHEVTVAADANATVAVTYTDADGNAVEASVNTGTYTAHVTVTRDNYVTVEQDVMVSIVKAAQDISYETTSVTVTEGDDDFTNPLTQTTVYGAITYTSSDESVATVDADGQVTIVGPGTATITATAVGSENYTEATATYTLTVETAEEEVSEEGAAGEEAAEEEEEESSSSDSGKSSSSSDSSDSSNSSSATTSSPRTGDESKVGLWLTLAITASFSLLATVIYSRKRTKEQ